MNIFSEEINRRIICGNDLHNLITLQNPKNRFINEIAITELRLIEHQYILIGRLKCFCRFGMNYLMNKIRHNTVGILGSLILLFLKSSIYKPHSIIMHIPMQRLFDPVK